MKSKAEVAWRRRTAVGAANRTTPCFGQPRLALFVLFALLALGVFAPAMHGEFVSDDDLYLERNPYVHGLTLANLRTIFDPSGAATAQVANYSPVFLAVLAVEWRCFGREVLPYHVVNVLGHALVALLLAGIFQRAGMAPGLALFGAAVFLLHPANVEAVAWITQLKTILCLVFAAAALLLHPRRPLTAAVCFALGLLTKTSALVVLPVALYDAWRRRGRCGAEATRFSWLAVWIVILLLYAAPQMAAFGHLGESPWPAGANSFDHLRTLLAIAGRYLVMATTTLGLSTFHNPPLTTPLLDPWWIGGLAASVVIFARAGFVARYARPEAGFWLWAAFAYAPVSQLFPFLFPMADRYLYVVLPGLIGAAGFASGAGDRDGGSATRARGLLHRGAPALAVAVLILLGVRSHERARVFESSQAMKVDAARHYPDGIVASLMRAQRLGREGDLEGALAALRRATDQRFDDFYAIDTEPAFSTMRRDPRFQAFVSALAGRWLEQARARGYANQFELLEIAQAHRVRGDRAAAEQALREGLARGGPADAVILRELEELRREERESGPPAGSGGAPAPDCDGGSVRSGARPFLNPRRS